tara:strand:+ start:18 stop:551 length:534 start_codon:yes stop_codon:yes gene_type:complete
MKYGEYIIEFKLEDVVVDGRASVAERVTIGDDFDQVIDFEADAVIEHADVRDSITVENLVEQIHAEDRFKQVLGHIHEQQTYFTPDLGKFRVVTLKEWETLHPLKARTVVPITPVAKDQSNRNLIAHMKEILGSFVAPDILSVVTLPDELERARVLMRLATMLHCSLDIGSTNEGGE